MMTMRKSLESNSYEWHYDARMGVGLFIRKSDGLSTMLETGEDCDNTNETLEQIMAKEQPMAFNLFDSIAGEYSYD